MYALYQCTEENFIIKCMRIVSYRIVYMYLLVSHYSMEKTWKCNTSDHYKILNCYWMFMLCCEHINAVKARGAYVHGVLGVLGVLTLLYSTNNCTIKMIKRDCYYFTCSSACLCANIFAFAHICEFKAVYKMQLSVRQESQERKKPKNRARRNMYFSVVFVEVSAQQVTEMNVNFSIVAILCKQNCNISNDSISNLVFLQNIAKTTNRIRKSYHSSNASSCEKIKKYLISIWCVCRSKIKFISIEM